MREVLHRSPNEETRHYPRIKLSCDMTGLKPATTRNLEPGAPFELHVTLSPADRT